VFLSDEFDNDWQEVEIIYRVSFFILVYEGEQGDGGYKEKIENRKGSGGVGGIDLNEKISKINMRLKEKDK
jgi:hypothetical protein